MRRSLWLLAWGCCLAFLALPLLAQQEGENANENANENEITIPEGTEFKLQLHSSVSSKTSRPGDRILTTLLDAVAVEDRDILTKGTRIDGHIAEVKAAARRGRGGNLSLVFDTVELPNGQKLAILGSLTEVFSSEGCSDPNVGPEVLRADFPFIAVLLSRATAPRIPRRRAGRPKNGAPAAGRALDRLRPAQS